MVVEGGDFTDTTFDGAALSSTRLIATVNARFVEVDLSTIRFDGTQGAMALVETTGNNLAGSELSKLSLTSVVLSSEDDFTTGTFEVLVLDGVRCPNGELVDTFHADSTTGEQSGTLACPGVFFAN